MNKILTIFLMCFIVGIFIIPSSFANVYKNNSNNDNNLMATHSGINNPPYVPSITRTQNSGPDDKKTGLPINCNIAWDCGDPDLGDMVNYTIYFGKNPDPSFKETIGPYPASEEIIAFNPGNNLEYSTTYYWRIVATDNHGDSVEGPVWSFTIKEQMYEVSIDFDTFNNRQIKMNIKNLASKDLSDLEWFIEMKSFWLGPLNSFTNGYVEDLPSESNIKVSSGNYASGLGFVKIKACVQSGDEYYTKEKIGFISGKSVIIF